MTWQPIATAPKPLKPVKIDLWVLDCGGDGYRVPDAWWANGGWRIKSRWIGNRDAFPWTHSATHWMHTPDDPKATP